MKIPFLLISLLLASSVLHSQTINKTTSSVVPGTVCPVSSTWYEVSVPSGLTSCQINWSATNGKVTVDPNNQRKAKVEWNDTRGALGTITATFTNCSNENSNGTSRSITELILSVKNQSWGSYGSSVNVDYCTKAQVNLTVPRMYVQGTGGIGQPPQVEVAYAWTLPGGWKEVGTGRTGSFGTSTNFISIEPIDCSKPGDVTVFGTLVGAGPFCNASEKSATATIKLNSPNPVATVSPPSGYTGGSACNVTPVTFSVSTSPALGCISGYDWTFPPSWSLVSQSGNSITLRPSGKQADANSIKATVNFSCGSSVTSNGYVPPYSQPAISGPDLICSTGTFTLQNASSASVTSWTSSNTQVLTINTSGVVSRVGSASGPVTLRATLSCDVPLVERTIWVGNPPADVNTLIWSGTRGLNPVSTNSGAIYTFNVDAVHTASTYTWILPPGFSIWGGSATTTDPRIYIETSSTSGTYVLYCRVNNACGFSWTKSLTINNGTGGGGDDCPPGVSPPCSPGGPVPLSVYPNPASSDLTIEIGESDSGNLAGRSNDASDTYEISVQLFDNLGKLRKSGKSNSGKLALNTSDLPDGLYILSITTPWSEEIRHINIRH
jgi:hypothetical protein